MLQPRIPLRSLCRKCQISSPALRRSYAQVIDPVHPSSSVLDTAYANPPLAEPEDRVGAAKGEVKLRRYTPRTPGIRHLIRPLNDHIWKGRPWTELTYPKKGHSKGGRNNTGHVVVRHRGGGHKRRIRTVDFMRQSGGKQLVERIEHDPGRTAHIALVKDLESGKRSYILAAEGLRAGETVESFRSGLPKELLKEMGGHVDQGVIASKTAYKGNCLKLGMIPVGTPIFNIAPSRDSIGKICRSAGTHGIIVGKGEDTVQKEMIKLIGDSGGMEMSALSPDQLRKFEKAANYVTVRLSSGEVRLIDKEAVATIGVASNVNFKYTSLGKAGRSRWLGIRPTVRGLAMNASDHPHGGGRGKSKGNRIPMSPWGIPAKSGFKTRPKNKINPMVVTARPRNQGRRRRGYA
ncbi:50S ribosomal protein L2 [Exophiala viscosa]|uniref:Large ribosomal subunit protein uL2m n=1 Tax=Exophiala viscosa TaxID=2486360 RepID=A0AAN6IG14_9EURO|nr:50S ribosomal protein L2 [Exophiala viscosa]